MNYDHWNQILVEEESGRISTAAVTIRAQERLVKEKSNNYNKNNKKPRKPEFNWEDYVQEEVWEEELKSEWIIENNQEQISNNNSEDWEDWETTNLPEDIEATLRRSPPPRENEWTPTMNGTLRIRSKDPRKCKDKEPEELKFHQPPPPSLSPTYTSPSKKLFCWNCKENSHTTNDC